MLLDKGLFHLSIVKEFNLLLHGTRGSATLSLSC